MPPESEVIKQQMGQTRAALTEKLETLENHVVGTVRDTTHTVAGTMHEVSATIRETVQDVRATVRETVATVKDALSISRQMDRHPWLLLAGSVFAGYLGERLLERVEGGRPPAPVLPPGPPGEQLPAGPRGAYATPLAGERDEARPAARPPRAAPSFLQSLAEIFAPEIDKLKRIALGTTLGLLRDKIAESVPEHLRGDVADLVDRVTVKLGGEPTPVGSFSSRGGEHEEGNGAEMARSMGMG